MTSRRCGSRSCFRIALAAAASGGATIAPSATAEDHGMSGTKARAANATATIVTPTAANTRHVTGIHWRRKSRIDVSNAESSNTGATNNASVSSGSSSNFGADGSNASPSPPNASNDGYGTLMRRASAVSPTAPTSNASVHSKTSIVPRNSVREPRQYGGST